MIIFHFDKKLFWNFTNCKINVHWFFVFSHCQDTVLPFSFPFSHSLQRDKKAMLLYYSSSDRNVLYDTSMTAIQFLFLDKSVKHRSIP